MLSEAAQARALNRGPGFLGFLVAHHGARELDRCYLNWWGERPVWVCARCLGLYPALLLVLTGLLLCGGSLGWWDLPWLFVLPLPAIARTDGLSPDMACRDRI